MNEDPRKTALKDGLRQLHEGQIRRLLVHVNLGLPVLLDRDEYGHANYSNGVYCPLAVAVGLDMLPECTPRTDEKVRDALLVYVTKIYNTRGVKGEFYTANRREDLVRAAWEVLMERGARIPEGVLGDDPRCPASGARVVGGIPACGYDCTHIP